jgi:hypothetical protein
VAQVELVAPVVQVELVVRGALEELAVRVVELELNQVEELELVQVEAELAADRRRVPPAVPPKNKSVIVVRHRGLVPVPKRAVDLAAAAAATMRGPVVTEAAAVWVAAE